MMRPRVFESLKRRHIYALAAFMLLVFILFARQSYRTMDRELTEAALSGRLSLSQLAAATLTEKLDRLTDIGISLATRVQFREMIAAGEWLEAGAILDSVPGDFPNIDRLFLADPDGTLMVDIPALAGDVRGSNFAHREWYQGVSANWEPFVSPVYTRTAIPQHSVFAVAVPIEAAGGELLGILVLQQELEGFFGWIRQIDVGPGGFMYVVDGRGRLAFHPDLPLQAELFDFSQHPAVQKAMQGHAGIDIVEDSLGEEKQIAAYVPTGHGWAVVAQQPVAAAFATRNRQLARVAIEYIVMFLLSLVLIWLAVRMLTQWRQLEEDRRMMTSLEEQWAFFRKIIDLDRNMIFAKDRDGRFVLVNEATAEVFGTTVENLLGKTNADFIRDPDSLARYEQDEREIMKTRQEKFFPAVKIEHASGRTRWLQTVMRPMASDNGEVDMILGVATDITERKRMEDELRANIERFEMVSRATNDAVWDWDLGTNHVWWNQGFRILFGYQQDEIGPQADFWIDCIHPDDRERVEDSVYSIIRGRGVNWSDKYRFRRRDGTYAYVFDRGFVLRDDSGKAVRMIGAMMDISEHHEQELKIARLNRIREVLSEINYSIVRARNREDLCREACRIAVDHGMFVMAWIGLVDRESGMITPVATQGADKGYLEVARFSVDEDVPEGRNLVSRAVREGRAIVSDDIETTAGIRYRQELLERGFRSFAVLPLSVGGDCVGAFTLYRYEADAFDEVEMKLLKEVASDISFALEYLGKEQQLNYLAYYDVLTGLPNRDLFTDRLTQALRVATDKKHVVGIVMIDIERFAYINETFGRHAGDQLLKQVAAKLGAVIPEPDQPARFAADTYALLLAGMKNAAEAARFIEEQIIPGLSEPMVVDDQQFNISIRIGVAVAPNDGQDAETLFRNAEAALKSAKRSGSKYLFYTRQMNALIAEKLNLENRLRQALINDEFVLAYQPKVTLTDGRIVGMEALIRWNSDTGLIPPDKFIPVLEETGLILDVGQWVIERAMLDYQDWLEKGLEPPPVAVNISAIQLRQSDFVSRIEKVLNEIPGNGSRLELEITETVIMEDLAENIEKLEAIRAQGVGISIDDFGTGYSSLRYMSRLPVTALKIDRAFVSNLISSSEDTAIVSAIIPLAHSMGLVVIAEGVETVDQVDLLKRLKCDQCQGYLFSPPLFLPDIGSMLQQRNILLPESTAK